MKRGFTLIELLVVVAVIAIVIGILVAALAGARVFASQQAERATVQALATGVSEFKREYGFALPLVHDGGMGGAQAGAMTVVLPGSTGMGPGAGATDAPVYRPDPNVPRLVPSAYRVGDRTDRNFLRGADRALGLGLKPGPERYDSMSQEWINANQRYSKMSLSYYLVGALPSAVDGVDGPGFVEPQRGGGFKGVTFDAGAIVGDAAATATEGASSSPRLDPLFDVGQGSVTLARNYFDPQEYEEHGQVAAMAPSEMLSARQVALVDRRGRAYRYYRWVRDEDILGTEDLNIPSVLINPRVLAEYNLAASPQARQQVDLTDGDPELRQAEWAVVGAGPNGVFGTEPLAVLERELGRNAGEAELRYEAWADNAVGLGR